MAITWDIVGTPISADKKEANIVATRSDSESPDNDVVVTLNSVSLNSVESKLRTLDIIFEEAQAELQRRIALATFQAEIDQLEILAKSNLEARE